MYKNKSSKYSRLKPNHTDTKEILYGIHPVYEALRNPKRKIFSLKATKKIIHELSKNVPHDNIKNLEITELTLEALNKELLPYTSHQSVVHQGVMLIVAPLPTPNLNMILENKKHIIILDQLTDPRNVGAILRASAVFQIGSVIMTRHNSPPSEGALAKAASGALEHIPLIKVGNLVRTLQKIAHAGYITYGLDEQGDQLFSHIIKNNIKHTEHPSPIACVIGAEGKGLRRLTQENCDYLVRLVDHPPTSFNTLNVATATAIALYEMNRCYTHHQQYK